MVPIISRLHSVSPVNPISDLRPFRNAQPSNTESQFSSDAVKLTLSPEAQRLLGAKDVEQAQSVSESEPNNKDASKEAALKAKHDSGPESELSSEEKQLLQRLQQSDTDVKIHEQQHVATAGGYVKSGPVYEYATGPDGKRYAVGGHVSLDISPIPNNPEATIRKAQVIKRAALAPADPSGADRSVAAAAGKMELQAREQLKAEQEKNLKLAVAKGQNSKIKAYTQSKPQLGQALNLLL